LGGLRKLASQLKTPQKHRENATQFVSAVALKIFKFFFKSQLHDGEHLAVLTALPAAKICLPMERKSGTFLCCVKWGRRVACHEALSLGTMPTPHHTRKHLAGSEKNHERALSFRRHGDPVRHRLLGWHSPD
jgi:hypothetical protein